MLELNDITVHAGSQKLFDSEKISLTKGVVALVGRNGSGKSTFLRTILGDHSNFSGEIKLNKKLISIYRSDEKAKLVSVVFSKTNLFGDHSVLDILMLGRLPHQNAFSKISSQDSDVIDRVATTLRIEKWLDKSFQILSDGEKQLVMIGRALAQETPLVLMDEPAAFLDIVNRYELSVLLKKIADETNKLIIYSTHQLDRIETDCDGLLLISHKKMTYRTERSEFLNNIHNAFGIL